MAEIYCHLHLVTVTTVLQQLPQGEGSDSLIYRFMMGCLMFNVAQFVFVAAENYGDCPAAHCAQSAFIAAHP